ncbi:hypothetical protein AYI70_g1056, partial [Smittium culicis]
MAKDKAKAAATAAKSTPAASDKQQPGSEGTSKTRANVLQFLETLDDDEDDDDDDDETDDRPHTAAADPEPTAGAAADAKNKRLDSRKVHDLLDQFTKDTETSIATSPQPAATTTANPGGWSFSSMLGHAAAAINDPA